MAAADAYQTDARPLRDLRRESPVGQILYSRERDRSGSQRESEDGGVRRVDLAVHGRIREIARQEVGSRVDRGLDALFSYVEIEIEAELEGDQRAAVRADRIHLL